MSKFTRTERYYCGGRWKTVWDQKNGTWGGANFSLRLDRGKTVHYEVGIECRIMELME